MPRVPRHILLSHSSSLLFSSLLFSSLFVSSFFFYSLYCRVVVWSGIFSMLGSDRWPPSILSRRLSATAELSSANLSTNLGPSFSLSLPRSLLLSVYVYLLSFILFPFRSFLSLSILRALSLPSLCSVFPFLPLSLLSLLDLYLLCCTSFYSTLLATLR